MPQIIDGQVIIAGIKIKIVRNMDDLKHHIVNYWENDEFLIAPATPENIAKAKALSSTTTATQAPGEGPRGGVVQLKE